MAGVSNGHITRCGRGGILAVWSGGPDRRFKKRLSRFGFDVEEHRYPAHPGGRRHVLWIAVRTNA